MVRTKLLSINRSRIAVALLAALIGCTVAFAQSTPLFQGKTVTVLSGLPRSGMQMTAWGIEFLDWNAKWVIGYRGTSELMVALERGEIDMTSTGNLFHVQRLLATGKFKVLAQTGMLKNGRRVARPE